MKTEQQKAESMAYLLGALSSDYRQEGKDKESALVADALLKLMDAHKSLARLFDIIKAA
jgi:hypothetical protein